MAAPWRSLLDRDDLAVRRQEDRWSDLEYTCHVRDVFRLYEVRLHLMLDEDDPLVAALRTWRGEESKRIGKPAYVVFDNKTLAAIAAARPGSLGALAEVSGVGPAKLERYGDAVLDVVRAGSAD